MEYRHLRHAGNFADVIKHSLLVLLLRQLTARHARVAYWESHAGAGAYRLPAGGGSDGIRRLLALDRPPAPLVDYLTLVRARQRGMGLRYPGSPCLAAGVLRSEDRLRLVERDAHAAHALRRRLRARAEVLVGDGYACVRDGVMHTTDPTLVLVDPPFVQTTELQSARALLAACAHRGTVCALLWYPLRADMEIDDRTWGALPGVRFACRVRSPGRGMWGCGLWVTRPPAGFVTAAAQLLDALSPTLAQDARAGWSCNVLGTDREVVSPT